MKRILILVLALMSMAFLCKDNVAQVDQGKENSPVSLKDLRSAPAEIVLDSKPLSLTAFPWRDFMPGNLYGAEGSPLMVGLRVTASDAKPFPSGVRIDRAWVILGGQIWEVLNLRTQLKSPADNQNGWINCSESFGCQATIREGPRWGPSVEVDVVVRLTDKGGQHYLIQSQKQKIQASH